MRLLSLSEVSIQKRTSPGKLGKRDFEISFANVQFLAFEMAGQPIDMLGRLLSDSSSTKQDVHAKRKA